MVDARQTSVLVREMGSFHVGGGLVTLAGLPLRQRGSTRGGPVRTVDPNGEIAAGQMYAQYVRLAEPRGRFPVLMWHGGGMSGVNWETTPDGRVGWQMLFLRAGLDVFVCDSVERGRASWAPYPQVYTSEPFFGPPARRGRRRFGSGRPDPGIRTRRGGSRTPGWFPGRGF